MVQINTVMAKASGGTRNRYPPAVDVRMVNAIRKEHQYDANWDITLVDATNGGYVATEMSRIAFSQKSPNEKNKYAKEKEMCIDLAHMGFQIEHLSEVSGISSSDIRIVKSSPKSLIKINGEYADLKALSSANNILRHGKDAIERQGASKVVFRFSPAIDKARMNSEINKLKNRNIHGIYYFEGSKGYEAF